MSLSSRALLLATAFAIDLKALRHALTGFQVPAPLPATQHKLDDYRSAGIFHQDTNSGAATGVGYPVSFAGFLTVKAAGPNFTYQTYEVYGGSNRARHFWRARFSSEPWTSWREVGQTYEPDTDWKAVTPATGWSSSMVVRRRNGIIQSRGAFNADVSGSIASGSFVALGTIPEGLRPAVGLLVGGSYTGPSALQFQVNATTGLIQARTSGSTLAWPAAANMSIAGNSW
ncbi:pyocin knob domain-containing protein [Sanguibacter sp. 25GB23B1]|uniref:pyocin knob domain-containing protein n=1 Tax=unclassified Sanguibacter TaxID=2645534 RepID=UPI0032AEBE44